MSRSNQLEASQHLLATTSLLSAMLALDSYKDKCTACITWEHNNTTVNSSISANNLTLNNIQYSHSGNYCCTANDYTMDCVSLNVAGEPC